MQFIIDGKIVREFKVSLAIGDPDFWVFLDVSEFKQIHFLEKKTSTKST